MAAFFERLAAWLTAFLIALSSLLPSLSTSRIDNVILLIGDGMGENHIAMTEKMRNVQLTVNTIETRGYSKTYSASSSVTDSAAGATALACGVKTTNGVIGMYPKDENGDFDLTNYPKNLTELLIEKGFKTGIVTTDSVLGATPSAFSAHATDRDDELEIMTWHLSSEIDLIWGKYSETVTEEYVTAEGYTYIDTIDEMNALSEGEKSYGMFTSSLYHTYNKDEYTPTLSQMTGKAIELLDNSAEDGFFLMIEGAHIDKKSHNEDEEGAAEALEEFDNAIKVALDFAKEDKHTLVVVTADHETGGVTLNENGDYEMTKNDHTGVNVPIFSYGPVQIIENGEIIENIEIPKRIANLLGIDDFPVNSTA